MPAERQDYIKVNLAKLSWSFGWWFAWENIKDFLVSNFEGTLLWDYTFLVGEHELNI